ncbi:MAG: helix-turn-helix domain-containing protein [Lachnospiraceae bacterium]|nr:helix-turn-helix domain-containing protein [Lachnospiraceae bacterium]
MKKETEKPLFHGKSVDASRILYTPSEFARDHLLYLQEAGKLHARRQHISSRENLPSLLFFCVLSGSGTLTYEQRRLDLSPGDCVFIDCHLPYSHETSKDLWSLSWVHFYGAGAAGIYEKYRERGGMPCFRPADPGIYRDKVSSLYALAGSQDYIRDMRISESLMSLLTLLMEESWHPELQGIRGKHAALVQVRNFLTEHYAEHLTLEDLESRFFINKYYLSRLFTAEYGLPPGQFLTQLRITHAKQLLRFSDLTAEEIAEQCGLGSSTYFSRMFKKVEGISPREYRKQW